MTRLEAHWKLSTAHWLRNTVLDICYVLEGQGFFQPKLIHMSKIFVEKTELCITSYSANLDWAVDGSEFVNARSSVSNIFSRFFELARNVFLLVSFFNSLKISTCKINSILNWGPKKNSSWISLGFSWLIIKLGINSSCKRKYS